MDHLSRRSVTSRSGLDELRREAMAMLGAGRPSEALTLVTAAWGSRATNAGLESVRGEVGVRCAIRMDDESLMRAALDRLCGLEHYSASRDLAMGVGRLALADMRATRLGLPAFFDVEGRSLLRQAREELRGTAWCDFEEADDEFFAGAFGPGLRPLRDRPSDWQREEAAVALRQSFARFGRVARTREEEHWDEGRPDVELEVAPLDIEVPPKLHAAVAAFDAARSKLGRDTTLGLQAAHRALDQLVSACLPRWPVTGGPWWSAPRCGLIIELSEPVDERGFARLALADTIADLEDDDDAQVFWWREESDAYDADGSWALYEALRALREALGHAARSGLAERGGPS